MPPHLPATGVPGQEGDIAPVGSECFDGVAHRGRPVFVVTEAEDQPVRPDDIGSDLEIEVGAEIDRVAVRFRPGDERIVIWVA